MSWHLLCKGLLSLAKQGETNSAVDHCLTNGSQTVLIVRVSCDPLKKMEPLTPTLLQTPA